MVVATWTTGGSWRKVLALKIIEAPQPAKADELTAEGIHCNRCVVTLNRIESSIKPIIIRYPSYPIVLIEHDWTYHIYPNPLFLKVGWVSHWPWTLQKPSGTHGFDPHLIGQEHDQGLRRPLCDCWAVNNDMARSTGAFRRSWVNKDVRIIKSMINIDKCHKCNVNLW